MTDYERREIEKIIDEPLPHLFEQASVAKIMPIDLGCEDCGADWHIFAEADALLTIPANIFSKPVEIITITVRKQAYILKYNQATDNYETIIKAPGEKGKYEIIIQIIYKDNTFEELHRTVLVDPYGYVYVKRYKEWNWKKPWQLFLKEEIKIPFAKATLYNLNRVGEWVVWPAHLYNQYNPQLTDSNGAFLFVVPKGKYYLEVQADNCYNFKGDIFEVKKDIVNFNVELKEKFGFRNSGVYLFYGIIFLIVLLFLKKMIKRIFFKK